jgi:hypothetical protein
MHVAQSAGDEQTIHRIEAFSDIVIGFCLAEIGLSLSIPPSGETVGDLSSKVFIFAASFLLVVMLWWNHHRLFKTYLVLNPATLIMNFALLGCLVLMLYFLQVGMRDVAVPGGGPHLFLRLGLLGFALVYGFLGGMYAIGVHARWASLARIDLVWGIKRMVSMFSVSAGFVIAVAVLGLRQGTFEIGGLQMTWFEIVILAMVVWLTLFRRVILPRFMRSLERS